MSIDMWRIPQARGPLPADEKSQPFCAMTRNRLGKGAQEFGYAEEEYLLSGNARVFYPRADGLTVTADLPYVNRVLVRRPVGVPFSGRLYVDILNASNSYDVEDFWCRAWRYCMENGHAYMGVTTKPCCVAALKNYDYNRYKTLNWALADPAPQPAVERGGDIDGCEDGLVWDILCQAAAWARAGGAGFTPARVYLHGQSQSGMYINTFVTSIHPLTKNEQGRPLFDGYMNTVGTFFQRSLCAAADEGNFLQAVGQNIVPPDVPFIALTSEGDLSLFRPMVPVPLHTFLPEEADGPHKYYRYYEVAGAPHTDHRCPMLPQNEEVVKAGRPAPQVAGLDGLNDLPLAFYVNGLLERLHIWATQGVAPPRLPRLDTTPEGAIVPDDNGNGKGGLQTVFTLVPAAVYTGSLSAGTHGGMVPFTKEKMQGLYGDKQGYLAAFTACARLQTEQGWLTPGDRDRAIAMAGEMARVFD